MFAARGSTRDPFTGVKLFTRTKTFPAQTGGGERSVFQRQQEREYGKRRLDCARIPAKELGLGLGDDDEIEICHPRGDDGGDDRRDRRGRNGEGKKSKRKSRRRKRARRRCRRHRSACSSCSSCSFSSSSSCSCCPSSSSSSSSHCPSSTSSSSWSGSSNSRSRSSSSSNSSSASSSPRRAGRGGRSRSSSFASVADAVFECACGNCSICLARKERQRKREKEERGALSDGRDKHKNKKKRRKKDRKKKKKGTKNDKRKNEMKFYIPPIQRQAIPPTVAPPLFFPQPMPMIGGVGFQPVPHPVPACVPAPPYAPTALSPHDTTTINFVPPSAAPATGAAANGGNSAISDQTVQPPVGMTLELLRAIDSGKKSTGVGARADDPSPPTSGAARRGSGTASEGVGAGGGDGIGDTMAITMARLGPLLVDKSNDDLVGTIRASPFVFLGPIRRDVLDRYTLNANLIGSLLAWIDAMDGDKRRDVVVKLAHMNDVDMIGEEMKLSRLIPAQTIVDIFFAPLLDRPEEMQKMLRHVECPISYYKSCSDGLLFQIAKRPWREEFVKTYNRYPLEREEFHKDAQMGLDKRGKEMENLMKYVRSNRTKRWLGGGKVAKWAQYDTDREYYADVEKASRRSTKKRPATTHEGGKRGGGAAKALNEIILTLSKQALDARTVPTENDGLAAPTGAPTQSSSDGQSAVVPGASSVPLVAAAGGDEGKEMDMLIKAVEDAALTIGILKKKSASTAGVNSDAEKKKRRRKKRDSSPCDRDHDHTTDHTSSGGESGEDREDDEAVARQVAAMRICARMLGVLQKQLENANRKIAEIEATTREDVNQREMELHREDEEKAKTAAKAISEEIDHVSKRISNLAGSMGSETLQKLCLLQRFQKQMASPDEYAKETGCVNRKHSPKAGSSVSSVS